MAVQNSDLLVVQTVPAQGETSKLYKLSVGDLDSYFSSDGDGTVRSIQTTLPLQDDGDTVNPTISIREATTALSGAVHRLAASADVADTNNAASTRAVVTANLLHATNGVVADLALRLTDAEVDLSEIIIKVGNLEISLGDLTLEVNGNTSDISDIKGDISDIQLELQNLEDQIGDFQGDIDGGIYAPVD